MTTDTSDALRPSNAGQERFFARTLGCAATIAACWLAVLASAPALSQSATPEQCAELLTKLQSARPTVTKVYRQQQATQDAAAKEVDDAELGDEITLVVENLGTLLFERDCQPSSAAPMQIVLYLDDRPLLDLEAYPPLDPSGRLVKFPLRRTEASRAAWTHLLGKPPWNARIVKVSLGLEDRFAINSSATLKLRALPHGWFFGWAALIAGLVVALFILARKSNVLRDGDMTATADGKRFSLSRVQAAWWFFLVLASYLLIGLVTGDYSTSITGTALVLLGIASGTTVFSTVIDRSRDTPEQGAKKDAAITMLEADVKAIDIDIATAVSKKDKNEETALKAQKASKQSQLRKLNDQSENLFIDIVSDANGVSLHRFQSAAWTIVLGIVFVVEVYRELAMPQFSETLLGLMGLSAGTFVAMKTTEANFPKP